MSQRWPAAAPSSAILPVPLFDAMSHHLVSDGLSQSGNRSHQGGVALRDCLRQRDRFGQLLDAAAAAPLPPAHLRLLRHACPPLPGLSRRISPAHRLETQRKGAPMRPRPHPRPRCCCPCRAGAAPPSARYAQPAGDPRRPVATFLPVSARLTSQGSARP